MLLELIQVDAQLKKITSTEWAGPCPWCGGTDRLHVWPEDNRWKCLGYEEGRNGCGRHGDSIQWLRDHRHMSFQDAAALAGGRVTSNPAQPKPPAVLQAPEGTAAPTGLWAERAWAFLQYAHEQMDGEFGNRA